MTRDALPRSRSARRRGDRAARDEHEPRPRRRARSDAPAPTEAPARAVPQGLPRESREAARTGSAQHREDALFYAPPYVTGRGAAIRAAADRLAVRFVEHLKPGCGLRGDQAVLTPYNCFRLDLLIERESDSKNVPERVGVLIGERSEAEGAPALYDALIVGAGAVDVLYRFDPEGLAAHLNDALALMHQHDAALFERDERLLAAASQGPCAGAMQGPETRLSYPAPPVEVTPGQLPERPEDPPDLVMRRLSTAAPAAWSEDYRRALDHFRVPAAQRSSPPALRQRAKAA
jgi:hypothetical protein